MFSLSLWEIVLVIAAIIIFLKPEDVPSFLRKCGKAIGKVKNFAGEVSDMLNMDLDDESDNKNSKKLTKTTILGQDGNYYEAYDVKEIYPDMHQMEQGESLSNIEPQEDQDFKEEKRTSDTNKAKLDSKESSKDKDE
jgi:Sec-independent protein translocase protein TatA